MTLNAADSLRAAQNQSAIDSLLAARNQSAIDSLRAQIPSGTSEIDPLGMLVQTVIYLALVALVLYAALRWGLPRLFGTRAVGRGSLELVERLPLGGSRSVCVVKVEGRKYLIGVTDHQVRTLDIIDERTPEERQEDLRR